MNAPIDTSRASPIAFATSRREGAQRWTELRVTYRYGERRPFVAEVMGVTLVPGERQRNRQRVEKTLDGALAAFDDSAIAEDVRRQAQAWEDSVITRSGVAAGFHGSNAPAVRFDGAGGLQGALAWLYAGTSIDTTKEARLVDAFAEDFGVPARTVRHTLAGQREGKELPSWCAAFIGALMHFDREAFHAMRRVG